MQSLLARHGKCTVKDGPLAGTLYEAVAADRLRKAAKRYTGDSDFQKFARSFVLLEDLKESNMPEPCQPLAPSERKPGSVLPVFVHGLSNTGMSAGLSQCCVLL